MNNAFRFLNKTLMQCCIVPVFATRDLVALQIKIGESGDQKEVVVCSDSGTPPSPKEFKELVEYCAERKLRESSQK